MRKLYDNFCLMTLSYPDLKFVPFGFFKFYSDSIDYALEHNIENFLILEVVDVYL